MTTSGWTPPASETPGAAVVAAGVVSIMPVYAADADGGVIREGYSLNYPIECLEAVPGSGSFPSPPVTGTAVLESVKKAEDSEELILWLYEAAGGSTKAHISLPGYRVVSLTNLLEEPIESRDLTLTPDGADLRLHPFEVHTLLLRKL